MTHISFVSMWFCGSLALVVLVQSVIFYFLPYWRYYMLFNVLLGVLIAVVGYFFLVESPMYLLLNGHLMEAGQSLQKI